MTSTVAVAHYPEGAGHATRMLAVARALEARGTTVTLAGGGPGARFIDRNGYDQFEPASVDFIGDYQGGSLLHVLGHSLPNSAHRVYDYVRWLRHERPDALVTDDMFAAMAAEFTELPLFVCTHNAASYYDAVIEQGFTWLLNRHQLHSAEAFLYPSIWPPDRGDPAGVTPIPPIALDVPPAETTDEQRRVLADGATVPAGTSVPETGVSAETMRAPEGTDVLVVPSAYSTGFAALTERLRAAGHDATLVGGEDWDCVPALLPYLRAAERVVCSGYSTIMEAAVAGTPCIVYPFTDEQHGVSRVIERTGLAGFQVEHSPSHVVRAVSQPLKRPMYENGAGRVAATVLAAIE
jgi:UDP:flavonoid glycosyltransferase YjiC (YdhE family)